MLTFYSGHQDYARIKICSDYPQTFKYRHNGDNLRWDVFVQQYGGLVCVANERKN